MKKCYFIVCMFLFGVLLTISKPPALGVHATETTEANEQFTASLKNLMFEQNIYRYEELKNQLALQGINKEISEIRTEMLAIFQQNPDHIISNAGGFIIVAGMMGQPVNQLSFIAGHNATNNDPDGVWDYDVLAKNHHWSMLTQLNMGVRMLDMDIGYPTIFGNPLHYHRLVLLGKTNTDTSVNAIKTFLNANPNDIIFVKFSDFFNNASIVSSVNTKKDILNFYLGKMNDYGIYTQIYNRLDGNVSMDNITTTIHSPMMIDMIGYDKRIIFMAKSINEDNMNYVWPTGNSPWAVTMDGLVQSWSAYSDHNTKLTILEYFPEDMAAGDRIASQTNNDGYRVYEMFSTLSEENTDDYSVTNFISLDFFQGNQQQGSSIEVTGVDAANRVNLQRFGGGWNTYSDAYFYWEDDPLGQQGNITESFTMTVMGYNNGFYTISNQNVLTDQKVFGLPNVSNGYDQFRVIGNRSTPVDISKIFFYLTSYNDYADVNYKVSAVKNGSSTRVVVKEGTLKYVLGKAWYVIEFDNELTDITEYMVEFSNPPSNLYIHETVIYDKRVQPYESLTYTNQDYYIFNEKSLKVVSTEADSSGNANVHQWLGATEATGQRWKLIPTGDGYFYIQNGFGKVLDVWGDNVYLNNNNVVLTQQWKLEPRNYSITGKNQAYTIRNRYSNQVISVYHAGVTDGTNIIQYDDYSTPEQTWYFAEANPK